MPVKHDNELVHISSRKRPRRTTTTTSPAVLSHTALRMAAISFLLSVQWNYVTAFDVRLTTSLTAQRISSKTRFDSTELYSSSSTNPSRRKNQLIYRTNPQRRSRRKRQQDFQRTMLQATTAAPFEEANVTRPFRQMRWIPTSRMVKLWILLCSCIVSVRGTGRAEERSTTTSAGASPVVGPLSIDSDYDAGKDQEAFVSYYTSQQQRSESRESWLKKVFNRRQLAIDREYQQRKEEWAAKYTSVEGLRETFGKSSRGSWGDLDAETTRRLYKTLLPYVLLEMYNMGVRVEDLAPLAYRARVAAKLYARERCFITARVAASLYDGMRTWTKYGKFNKCGMTYEQLWKKYAAQVSEECRNDEACNPKCLTDDVVSAKICHKILERSCVTNGMVDRLVLTNATDEEQQELQVIIKKLEQDVRELTKPPKIDRRSSRLNFWRRPSAAEGNDDTIDSSDSPLSAEQCPSPLGHLSTRSIKTLRSIVSIKKHLETLPPVVHTKSFLNE